MSIVTVVRNEILSEFIENQNNFPPLRSKTTVIKLNFSAFYYDRNFVHRNVKISFVFPESL